MSELRGAHLSGQPKWLATRRHVGDAVDMHIDVTVDDGVVRGTMDADLAVFRGIPYAEPGVRFGAPQPVRAWHGVREATRFGPPPPQSGAFGMDAHAEEGDG